MLVGCILKWMVGGNQTCRGNIEAEEVGANRQGTIKGQISVSLPCWAYGIQWHGFVRSMKEGRGKAIVEGPAGRRPVSHCNKCKPAKTMK